MRSLFFLAAIAATMPALAEVREIKTMSEIQTEIGPDTLVVFDLDNTLIAPVQTLGSDQWYGYLVDGFRAQGLSDDESITRALALWTPVQQITRVKAIEATTPNLVAQLQARGVRVLGLTARDFDVAAATRHQLNSVGMDLSLTSGLSDGELVPAAAETAQASGGIIFVGARNNKGQVLATFLQQRHLHPSKIVFVDDKTKHVHNVDAALAPTGIPYLGFRYGAADAAVAAFNPQIADLEFSYFPRLLSDEAAQALLLTTH